MSPACCLPPAAAAPRRASGLVASTNSWPSSDQGSTKDSRAKSRALATTSDSRHGCSQRARPWRGRLPSCGWPRIYRPAVWRWCPTLQQCGPLLRHRHSPGGLGHAAAMRPGWPAHGSTRRVSWVSAPMTSSRHSEPPPMSRPNGGPPPPGAAVPHQRPVPVAAALQRPDVRPRAAAAGAGTAPPAQPRGVPPSPLQPGAPRPAAVPSSGHGPRLRVGAWTHKGLGVRRRWRQSVHAPYRVSPSPPLQRAACRSAWAPSPQPSARCLPTSWRRRWTRRRSTARAPNTPLTLCLVHSPRSWGKPPPAGHATGGPAAGITPETRRLS